MRAMRSSDLAAAIALNHPIALLLEKRLNELLRVKVVELRRLQRRHRSRHWSHWRVKLGIDLQIAVRRVQIRVLRKPMRSFFLSLTL